MPPFRGGDAGRFREWPMKHLEYPSEIACATGSETVIVGFVVECDGSVTASEMKGGKHPALKRALWRTILKCTRWTPGIRRDSARGVMRTVSVRFSMPVIFHAPRIRLVLLRNP